MEFWGVEVKPGVPLKVEPHQGQLIHVSQAALGEAVKDVKGAKNIPLRMKVDGKDFVIGFLKPEERTQLMFDLVFEKEFELSHDWKNGSIYFIGYLAADPISDEDYISDDSFESSEDEALEKLEKASANGVAKPAKGPAAAAVKAETKKDESESDDDDDVSEDGSDDEDMELSLGGDSSDDLSGDDSEEDDSEEEEVPKNVQKSKKRPAESAQAAPISAKKAKSITPEKTGNKKGQNATPSKASGKNATGKTPPSDKSKQSPKSGGQFSGKSGNKSFNSKAGKGKRGGK
ncbi:histone deacetylase hdt1 [Phtheirospermum japonicum]|uniref:Histone deacetylase hdt1 n=1 Tax=Phtheirospermum japonicum TaxID=374723 RepID=A0A830DFK9_9LAMI|nr:histone deacetylase hdt1 [Phtheirospermum japonicum]